MSTIVTRAGKGSALTHNEVDANFTNLNTDKLQSGNTAASLTITSADINGGTIDGTSVGSSSASTGAFTTLSATGVTTVQAGTASAPAITTSGDTNTGIFFPAADTIAFAEGGAEAMRINSSGNVGIGTSSPAYKLDVAGAISTNNNLTFTGTGNRITGDFSNATVANRVMFQTSTVNGNTLIGAVPNGSSTTAEFGVANASDPTNAARFRALITSTESRLDSGIFGTGTYLPMTFFTGGSERMRVDTTGRLGLGTTSPEAKLDVRGSSTFLVNATNPTAWISVDSALTTGSMYNQWNTTSNLGISGTYTNHPYTFVTNNTERMRIDTSGNVGIGTSSPAANSLTIASKNVVMTSGFGMSWNSNATQLAGYDTNILQFITASAERMRIDSSGFTQFSSNLVMPYQGAPTSKAAAATLTGAELVTGILNTTGTTYTITLPTGTNIESALTWAANNVSLDFFVINTASGTITIGANGNTTLGSLTIATGTSAQFRIRRTAANTFTVYRLG